MFRMSLEKWATLYSTHSLSLSRIASSNYTWNIAATVLVCDIQRRFFEVMKFIIQILCTENLMLKTYALQNKWQRNYTGGN